MARLALLLAWLGCALAAAVSPAGAQGADPNASSLHLAATLGAGGAALSNGLHWRLFAARAESDGSHALIAESGAAQPTLNAPPGDYVVHVAFGLASATRILTLTPGENRKETLAIAAGALRVGATQGLTRPIDAANVSLAIYVPERNNPQAKLVYSKARLGDVIGLPEGAYHIVSTYLDTVGVGSLGLAKGTNGAANPPVPTNSVVAGDVRVAAGKIVDVTLRHRFATVTIKLVKGPGGEALANSTFTVLTPGGDIIRELIGAFPSLVLAEGDYVVIARHDAKTYQSEFPVQSGMDRDIEVIAKDADAQGQ